MAGRIKLRDINQDPATRREASGGSEVLPGFTGGSHGAIAYRGAEKWETLGPGTSGYALQTKGAGANPVWSPVIVTVGGPLTAKTGAIVSSYETAIT